MSLDARHILLDACRKFWIFRASRSFKGNEAEETTRIRFFFFFFFFTRLTHFFHEKNKIWDSRLKRDRDSSGTIIEIPVSWRKISPGREQTGCFLFQGPIYFLSYISRQPHKVFRALVVLWWNGFYIIAIIPRCVDNTGLDPIEILEAIFSWSSSFFPSLFPFLLKYTYPFPFPNIDAFDAFH